MEKQRLRDLLTMIKKNNGTWDKVCREANQVLVASSGHRYSKDTNMEAYLAMLSRVGSKLDAEVVAFEALVGVSLTSVHLKDIDQVTQNTDALGMLCKDIRKKMKRGSRPLKGMKSKLNA